MFMARFGRAAAVHVVEQVQERVEPPREMGIEARFAGREVTRPPTKIHRGFSMLNGRNVPLCSR